jgi:predicted AAA+ superfamily ATPase
MRNIYKREFYLRKIRPFYKTDLIKVITGIRRCGKSCLMLSIQDELRALGISDQDILYLNLDQRGNKNIKSAQQLDEKIESMLHRDGYKYLFVDEVQNVKNFEEVINAYREEGNFSIFVTGSNSYLLSGELVTKLTGRYIEINLFTLSFSEYLEMKKFHGQSLASVSADFTDYLRYGGFPQTLEFNDASSKAVYLANVIEQIMHKDVKVRNIIRNQLVFERVRNYLINNFGTTTNLVKILDWFEQVEQVRIKPSTIKRYIDILENARILYKCPRFDVKSRKSLSGGEKYYLADVGIYFAMNTDGRINYGPVLENLFYVYLRSRGYQVSVGRIGELECDFIVRRKDEYFYVQIAMSIADRKTEDREYRPFEKVKDNHPKYLFTLDPLLQKRDGVKHLNLLDFMAAGEDLV